MALKDFTYQVEVTAQIQVHICAESEEQAAEQLSSAVRRQHACDVDSMTVLDTWVEEEDRC